LDIVRLTTLGNRALRVAPRSLDAYAIFGDVVYSPCDGKVVAARDGLDDNPPSHPDLEHPEGNQVVLKCGNAEILMAHLLRGSIAATAGDTALAGQPLGRVGNSGNSMEPHLHIGAKMGDSEVPLLFDGRILSVNDLVRPGRGASSGRS